MYTPVIFPAFQQLKVQDCPQPQPINLCKRFIFGHPHELRHDNVFERVALRVIDCDPSPAIDPTSACWRRFQRIPEQNCGAQAVSPVTRNRSKIGHTSSRPIAFRHSSGTCTVFRSIAPFLTPGARCCVSFLYRPIIPAAGVMQSRIALILVHSDRTRTSPGQHQIHRHRSGSGRSTARNRNQALVLHAGHCRSRRTHWVPRKRLFSCSCFQPID